MTNEKLKTVANKIEEKAANISRKIKQLKNDVDNINAEIASQHDELIEHQLEEQDTTQIQKRIKQLNESLQDKNDSIAAYERKLSSRMITDREIRDLRKAFAKEKDSVSKERNRLYAERNQVEKEIDALKKRLDTISLQLRPFENGKLETESFTAVNGILKYIDQRSERLMPTEKKEFVIRWLEGEDTNRFFKKDTWTGVKVTTGPGELGYIGTVKREF